MLCLCRVGIAQTRQTLPVQQEMIKFYPNPASFFINFEFQKSYDRTHILQIYNFMGKKVQEVRNTPSRISLRLDEYYRGIYIFQLRDKYGHILESGRFQVIK
jgi:hypothetical protein